MRLLALIPLSLALSFPLPSLGQDTTSECIEDCIVGPIEVATGDGSFAGSEALNETTQADAIAALEQQALREFRWDVMAPAQVTLSFEALYNPPEAAVVGLAPASATFLVSTDGERFAPLPTETVLAEGQVVAVIIRQGVVSGEEERRFLPSAWAFDLTATPIPPLPGPTLGPVLLPIAFGDDLGCETPGCGEEAVGAEVAGVQGDPQSEAGSDGTTSSGGTADADKELARELQTELARVGCYSIAIDGLWGPGSRRAMTAYNAAAGKDLPVQMPTAKALVEVAKAAEGVCSE